MSKLGRNDWLVIGGMLLLFVALFMPWFRSEVVEDLMDQMAKQLGGDLGDTDTGVSGWHYALGWLAWLLTAAAAAIVLLKLVDVELPLPQGLSVLALGGVAFVLVLVQDARRADLHGPRLRHPHRVAGRGARRLRRLPQERRDRLSFAGRSAAMGPFGPWAATAPANVPVRRREP